MTTRDLFDLGVRALGLVFLYHLLQQLPTMVSGLLGEVRLDTIVFVAWHVLITWWLLRGAPLVMRIAYGRANRE